MAQHHHALNLPEILFRIGRHLESLEDVEACSLVSKTFRASFEPYLWMDIHLKYSHVKNMEERRQEPLTRFVSLRCHGIYWKRGKGQIPRKDRILQGLQRIAPWIRSLAVHSHHLPLQLRFGDRCTGINTLLIAGIPLDDQFDETYWNDCEALLKQNSACLRSLTLLAWRGRYHQDHYSQPLWKLFLACTPHANLTTLRIKESRMSEQDLEAFWRICRQIEILELTDMKIENIWAQSSHNSPSQAGHGLPFEEQLSTSAAHSLNSGTSTNWSTSAATTTRTVRLPKLRELTLDGVTMDAEQQLKQIILHCPLLQNLNWKSGYSDHVMGQFCDYLAARTWACLDWIEIKREERYVTDQEHALLLQSAPRPFRRLDVNVGLFGEQTFRLYREYGHFTTLTKIDLRPSMALSLLSLPGSSVITVFSRRVQEVLESCPALEHIAALMITAQDIIQGKPWVCFRLKKFEVMINMQFSDNSRDQKGLRTRLKYSEDDRVLCHQIFERLGQLSQLAVLDMRPRQEDWIHHFDIKTTSLPLRLRMGLRYLSTLRNIEMIGCYGSQKVRLGDLEWMLQHWNKLQKIVGDSLSVKWSRVRRGELDERSKLVMKNLNARDVQLTLDIDARRYTASGELEAYYGTESESESENVMQAK